MTTIKLSRSLVSCITDGERLIPAGTVMNKVNTCCSWVYYKGDGYTLIIMGFDDVQRDGIEFIS